MRIKDHGALMIVCVSSKRCQRWNLQDRCANFGRRRLSLLDVIGQLA
jgi:hypothetical protein